MSRARHTGRPPPNDTFNSQYLWPINCSLKHSNNEFDIHLDLSGHLFTSKQIENNVHHVSAASIGAIIRKDSISGCVYARGAGTSAGIKRGPSTGNVHANASHARVRVRVRCNEIGHRD